MIPEITIPTLGIRLTAKFRIQEDSLDALRAAIERQLARCDSPHPVLVTDSERWLVSAIGCDRCEARAAQEEDSE